jgi:hypothetical protein
MNKSSRKRSLGIEDNNIRKRVKVSTVNNYHGNYSNKKDINNKLFAKHVTQCLPSGNSLVLDDTDCLTSHTLIKYGVPANNIFAAQINSNKIKLMKKHNVCKVYNGSVNNVMHRIQNVIAETNAIYLDYNGTATGNKTTGMFPLEDMSYFLDNTKQKQLIVAVTFCSRSVYKKFPNRKSMCEQITKDYLKPLFKYNQYKCEILESNRYVSNSAPMFFVIFRLIKDPQINSDNVEFVIEHGKFHGYKSN